jgi:hypothetical protein
LVGTGLVGLGDPIGELVVVDGVGDDGRGPAEDRLGTAYAADAVPVTTAAAHTATATIRACCTTSADLLQKYLRRQRSA